jgi:hypothetical protein
MRATGGKCLSAAVLLLYGSLTGCSGTPEQINFVLRMESSQGGRTIERVLQSVALREDLVFKSQQFNYGGGTHTLPAFTIYNHTATGIAQSQLVDCPPGSRPFQPCFSENVYTISVYRSSIFKPQLSLGCIALEIIAEARKRGGVLVGPIELKSGASLSCPGHR